jgi:hypothetical protein
VGKLEGTRPVSRHRHRWEEDIKMVLNSVGWEGVDWINLAQDRDKRRAIAHMVMQLLSEHSLVTCFLCHSYHVTYSLLLLST